MTDDAELLRRYVEAGSEDDFSALVRRHAGLVYGCALRQVGDRGLAEDVTQLAFVALARHAHALSQRENIAGWLFTTTRYLSCNELRKARRRTRREAQEAVTAPESEPRAELASVMDEVLCELKTLDREIVLLRFYSGLRFAEIAPRLGLSENAIQKRTDRALEAMREILARRGIASTAAALVAALEAQGAVALPAGLAAASASAALGAQALAGPALLSLLMAIPKLQISLAALLLAAGIFYMSRQADTLRELRAEIGATRQRTEHFRESAGRKGNANQPDTHFAPPAPASPAPGSGERGREGTAPADAPTDPAEKGRAFFERNPSARQLWEEAERSVTLLRFGPLFADLNLPPEQQEQFLELMNRARHNTMLAGANGLIKLQHSSPLSTEETEEGLKRLLGERSYAQYQQYNRLYPALELAGRFAALVNSVDPLAPRPAAGLAQILAEASVDYRAGREVRLETVDWTAVLASARDILSPAQLSLLSTVKVQSESDRAVTEFVMARATTTKPGK